MMVSLNGLYVFLRLLPNGLVAWWSLFCLQDLVASIQPGPLRSNAPETRYTSCSAAGSYTVQNATQHSILNRVSILHLTWRVQSEPAIHRKIQPWQTDPKKLPPKCS